jgi:hypothetical protein
MMLINFDLEDQPQRRELSASSMVGSRMLSCIPSPFDPWGSEYQQNFSVSYIKISCQGLVLAGLFFYNGMKSCQQMLDFFMHTDFSVLANMLVHSDHETHAYFLIFMVKRKRYVMELFCLT